MPKYIFFVTSNVKKGHSEAEYNDWYDNTHLDDVVALKEIKTAQRFKLAMNLTQSDLPPYLALYEVETDDLGKVMEEFNTRSGTERMMISDALDLGNVLSFYESFGPEVKG